MQSHTAQIRHKNCCSCFTGNFQTILATVLTAEATSGRSPNSRIIRMWKWFYQNACKCKSPVPTVKEYLNSCQLRTNSSVCLGTIMIHEWNKWATLSIVITSYLIFKTHGTLIITHLLYTLKRTNMVSKLHFGITSVCQILLM